MHVRRVLACRSVADSNREWDFQVYKDIMFNEEAEPEQVRWCHLSHPGILCRHEQTLHQANFKPAPLKKPVGTFLRVLLSGNMW